MAPADFVAECRRRWPDFRDIRMNDHVQRWEFIFASVVGKPVSQFFGWDRNPLTGNPIEADPLTGLLPFRDLTPEAQAEILAIGDATYLGNREDGAQTHVRHIAQVQRHNDALFRKRAKQNAENYADILAECDLRRPFLKFHSGTARERRIAYA